jgi:ATP-dependent RNA helicase DHX37/DHR1
VLLCKYRYPLIFSRQSQAEVQSLRLQSSSTLGTGKAITNLEKKGRLEDKEIRRALDGTSNKRKRHGGDNYAVVGAESEDEDFETISTKDRKDFSSEDPINANEPMEVTVVDSSTSAAVIASAPPSAVGSALKRNADGSVVTPKIGKPKVKNGKVCGTHISFDFSDIIVDTVPKLEKAGEGFRAGR